jgi:hypothetical protein
MAGTASAISILRKDPCVYCGEYYRYPVTHKKAGKLHATIDHIHPKGRGGKNSWQNYAPACVECNSAKSDNSLLGHLLGKYIPSEHADLQVEFPDRWYDPLGMVLGIYLTRGRS